MKNFGKIHGVENKYHCHIKSGRPTYVAVWMKYKKDIEKEEVLKNSIISLKPLVKWFLPDKRKKFW